jgi:hypothetical protein
MYHFAVLRHDNNGGFGHEVFTNKTSAMKKFMSYTSWYEPDDVQVDLTQGNFDKHCGCYGAEYLLLSNQH